MRRSITRRGLFRATGAATLAGMSLSVLGGCRHSDEAAGTPTVVDSSAADYIIDPNTNESRFSQLDTILTADSSFTIPLGNVLRPGNSQNWLAMTTAGSSALPVVVASAFSPQTGAVTEVVSQPQSQDTTNTAIYDVRCSDELYAWVELHVIDHSWQLYASSFKDGALQDTPVTLWSADANYDPPRFAVSANRVVWEVMPAITGTKKTEPSLCYLWTRGSSEARSILESPGRFATDPQLTQDTITLVPRVNADSGVFYAIQTFKIQDQLSDPIDTLVFPQTVKPMNAVRIGDTFAFSIEANYSTGGLLGQMGTYIGRGEGPFIVLSREPSAAVCGKDDSYIIKNRSSYFVVNTKDRSYSVLAAENRSLDFGEYPATVGEISRFTTYSTVKDQDTGYPKHVTVRSFLL